MVRLLAQIHTSLARALKKTITTTIACIFFARSFSSDGVHLSVRSITCPYYGRLVSIRTFAVLQLCCIFSVRCTDVKHSSQAGSACG